MHLCIQDNGVPLPEDHISVGDERLILALDENDHSLAGDVQVTDTLAVPWIVFLQDYLLEVNMLAVPEGFCPKDNGIIYIQYRIAARD